MLLVAPTLWRTLVVAGATTSEVFHELRCALLPIAARRLSRVAGYPDHQDRRRAAIPPMRALALLGEDRTSAAAGGPRGRWCSLHPVLSTRRQHPRDRGCEAAVRRCLWGDSRPRLRDDQGRRCDYWKAQVRNRPVILVRRHEEG